MATARQCLNIPHRPHVVTATGEMCDGAQASSKVSVMGAGREMILMGTDGRVAFIERLRTLQPYEVLALSVEDTDGRVAAAGVIEPCGEDDYFIKAAGQQWHYQSAEEVADRWPDIQRAVTAAVAEAKAARSREPLVGKLALELARHTYTNAHLGQPGCRCGQGGLLRDWAAYQEHVAVAVLSVLSKVAPCAQAAGTYKDPLVVDRRDLDLSGLRAHCREHHGEAPRRSNLDLANWHSRQHHRLHLGHTHPGPLVLIRNMRGQQQIGSMPRPLGWFTGQDAVTREQADAAFCTRQEGI